MRQVTRLTLITALIGALAVHPATAATPQPSVSPMGLPIPNDALPGGPSVPFDSLDQDVRDAYSGVGLLWYIPTCTAVLIRPFAGEVPATAPAYVLTNGHCVDAYDATTVMRDVSVEPGKGVVDFGMRPDGSPVAEVSFASIRWATMKGTDVAIVELDATLADLLARGVAAYPLASTPAVGSQVVVVGGPGTSDGSERQLHIAACATGPTVDLFERQWTWFGFPSNDCADILPGTSGSPILDPATGAVVGLVNTTTQGSAGVPDCAIGRPCEFGQDGVASREDTSYGPTVDVLTGCFDASGVFTGPSDTCALDPGDGLGLVSWTMNASPGVVATPPDGPAPSTWYVELAPASPEQTWMRVGEGPAEEIDCHDPTVYGEPLAIPSDLVYDPALPTEDGSHVMCLLGGTGADASATWQSPDFPTVIRVNIDRVSPTTPIELSVQEDADGWMVEPIYQPPDLSLFMWKWGPPDTTDCADQSGYAVYRRFPMLLPFADAPTRLCVIGYDDASNASEPLDRVFSRP